MDARLTDDVRASPAHDARSSQRTEKSSAFFFLTFECSDSIYESRCDFLSRKFELGESIDEERNQESCCEEESGPEEKEVVHGFRFREAKH